MRVILTENEILTAIEDYVLGAVVVPDDIRIDIDLKATRGDAGYTAEIDLVHMSSPSDGSDRSVDDRIEPTEEARQEGLGIVEKIEQAKLDGKAPRRRGRPVGSKNQVTGANQPSNSSESKEVPVISAPASGVSLAPTEEDKHEPQEAEKAVSQEMPVVDEEPIQEEPVEAKVESDPEPDPEPSEEEQLAAEAQATEPVEEVEEEAQPEPDPQPEPEVTKPTRSLFANLKNK